MFSVVFQKKDFSCDVVPSNLQELFENYDPVYACKAKNLEDVFRKGNLKFPLKYPLSVGDVVLVGSPKDVRKAYMVMPVGWKFLFEVKAL